MNAHKDWQQFREDHGIDAQDCADGPPEDTTTYNQGPMNINELTKRVNNDNRKIATLVAALRDLLAYGDAHDWNYMPYGATIDNARAALAAAGERT